MTQFDPLVVLQETIAREEFLKTRTFFLSQQLAKLIQVNEALMEELQSYKEKEIKADE